MDEKPQLELGARPDGPATSVSQEGEAKRGSQATTRPVSPNAESHVFPLALSSCRSSGVSIDRVASTCKEKRASPMQCVTARQFVVPRRI